MGGHSFPIGRIRGIQINVHWSWILIYFLLTWSLATAFFPQYFPFWSAETLLIVAAISSLLLFGSVLLHELAHSFVALAEGIPVRSITLFIFGGVSNIQSDPTTAGDEFKMAFAGPLTSLVVGLISYALLRALGGGAPSTVLGVLLALAYYNVTLAVFNLIPGFPLDGGRVFRSIVWAITHNFREATTVATAVGHVFGYLFIGVGLVLMFLSGDFLGGIWLIFIGMFLNNAAEMAKRQVELQSQLGGVQVAAVMRANPPEVRADTTVFDFVEHFVLARNLRVLPVVDEGDHLAGMVTLGEARQVPREKWQTTTVADVMLSVDRLTVARPDEPLVDALRDLSEDDGDQLPVVDHGNLVGLLTRGDVIRFLQVRQELHHPAA